MILKLGIEGGRIVKGISCSKESNMYYVHLDEKQYTIGSVVTAARKFVEEFFIKVDYAGHSEYIVRFKPKGQVNRDFQVQNFYDELKFQSLNPDIYSCEDCN